MITYIFVTGYSIIYYFFFFKQKTAYEMRISDWSSDVCSSDLSQELRTKREHTSLFGLVGFKRVAVNAKKREEYVLHIGFIHFRGCLCGGDDHHNRNASAILAYDDLCSDVRIPGRVDCTTAKANAAARPGCSQSDCRSCRVT